MIIVTESRSQSPVQGHRGCRGLYPENTIEGFIHALKLGVGTLEMDVVITSDRRVLVSHEPYMSHQICLDPEGEEIPKAQEKSHNIYRMTADQVRGYDCGIKFHPGFPEQIKIPASKPLLSIVIDSVEAFIRKYEMAPVDYNIEIKSTPATDNLFHPGPVEFSDLVYGVLIEKGIVPRTILQSFDPRPLRHLREKDPGVRLALLVENARSPGWNIRRLGFTPDIYSPYYRLIGNRQVRRLQEKGVRVIPWTVNEPDDMKKLTDMGVDGIITDYPDRYFRLFSR